MTGEVLMLLGNGYALVSREDYAAMKEFNWTVYRSRSSKYLMARVDRGTHYERITMHRLITAAGAGEIPDHINGNGLDNRRENLRICTPQQNSFNRRPVGARKYKGVKRAGDQWVAAISASGRRENLGRYDSEAEAARAYNDAARRLHGEFAYLNDVPDGPGVRAPSRVHGYSWHRYHHRYIASYRGKFLGYFETIAEAKTAHGRAKEGFKDKPPRLVISRRNTSGYRGVSWNKSSQRWVAHIRVGRKGRTIGSFINKEEAAMAYDAVAKELHGERALINFCRDHSPAKEE